MTKYNPLFWLRVLFDCFMVGICALMLGIVYYGWFRWKR